MYQSLSVKIFSASSAGTHCYLGYSKISHRRPKYFRAFVLPLRLKTFRGYRLAAVAQHLQQSRHVLRLRRQAGSNNVVRTGHALDAI